MTSGSASDNKSSTGVPLDELLKEESIQILSNSQRTKQLYLSLVRNSQKEVLLIFPTTNTVRREEGVGVFGELRRACRRGVTIRILTPEDDFVKDKLAELRNEGMIVRQIETPAEAKFKLLVVDKKFSLVIETKDDSKGAFEQAVGLATFSNSKSTVLPYETIFESFWRETDLYEKAREADKIKDEFVNIAAHELRNPISPIMASGELAIDDLNKIREGNDDPSIMDSLSENLSIMIRNANKLYKLSEDILQVSRIESGTFVLNIERLDFKPIMKMAIQDARRKVQIEGKKIDINLDYQFNLGSKGGLLYCDNSKINQVLYNLLDNAIKFTDQGRINVSAGMHNEANLLVKIEDSGKGIDVDMKDRLFIKFASKSSGGTGLGLYLTKKIIEAHGGRIWAANNANGVGATFSFTLPTDLRPSASENITKERNESRNDIEEYTQKTAQSETGLADQ